MNNKKPEPGTVTWIDLTVNDADNLRDFYSEVVGWKNQPVSMGDYNDYTMHSLETNKPVTGVCHKKGTNAELPSHWLIYINVENLEKSIESCNRMGGKIISGPKETRGYGKYCVIEDPAGAVCALFEPENSDS